MANYAIVDDSGEIGSQLTEYYKGKGHTILLDKHKNTVGNWHRAFSTHISSVETENFNLAVSFIQYGIETLGSNDGFGNLRIL